MISPNSFVQYVWSSSKHGFIGFAAVTPLDPLPLTGIGLSRLSTYPRRTDGVELALVPVADLPVEPGGFGARVGLRPRVVPELLLGRDEVEFVTLLLEVRVKFKSELSSDIVLRRASISRATMLITYERGSIILDSPIRFCCNNPRQANTND